MLKFKWVEDDRNKKILYERNFGNKKKKRKNFVIDWEKNLDWSGNPFLDIIHQPINIFKANLDHESKTLNKFFIQGNKFGIIRGKKGSGKTFLLKWLEEELKTFENKFNIFYFDAKTSNHKTLIKLLLKHFSSFSLFKNSEEVLNIIKSNLSKNKKTVFLIDDADLLPRESVEILKKVNSFNHVSIIFTTCTDNHFKDFGDDEANIHIKPMNYDSIKDMIVKRIENYNGVDIEPFNSIQLKTLAKKAAYNPRDMLKLCNEKAIEIALKKVDTIEPFEDVELEIEEEKDINELKQSLPEGVLEGDVIVQEIVGEFNIDNLIESKKKK
jgi:Cdc6-like AAA superfamily ATPase